MIPRVKPNQISITAIGRNINCGKVTPCKICRASARRLFSVSPICSNTKVSGENFTVSGEVAFNCNHTYAMR